MLPFFSNSSFFLFLLFLAINFFFNLYFSTEPRIQITLLEDNKLTYPHPYITLYSVL